MTKPCAGEETFRPGRRWSSACVSTLLGVSVVLNPSKRRRPGQGVSPRVVVLCALCALVLTALVATVFVLTLGLEFVPGLDATHG